MLNCKKHVLVKYGPLNNYFRRWCCWSSIFRQISSLGLI